MRFFVLSILISVNSNHLFAQISSLRCPCGQKDQLPEFDNKLGYKFLFKPNSTDWASEIVMNPATHKLVSVRVIASANSFYYYQFDSLEHIIAYGLLLQDSAFLNKEIYKTADQKNDPDGSKGLTKDTLLTWGVLLKDGYWKEKDSLGFTWIGNYKNGCREGYWSKGHYQRNSEEPERWFFVRSRIYYSNNIADSSSFSDFSGELWPVLKGKWYIYKMKGDTMSLSRLPNLTRFQFNFFAPRECQFKIPSTTKDEKIVRTAGWDSRFIDFPSLDLYYEGRYYRYEVLELNNNHLLLRLNKGNHHYQPLLFHDYF